MQEMKEVEKILDDIPNPGMTGNEIHRNLLPVYILHFINFFNLMLWLPILDPILGRLHVDPKNVTFISGLIISMYPVSQFLAIQPLNTLSEKYGRKVVLFCTQLGTILSLIIAIIALSVPMVVESNFINLSLSIFLLMLARVIDGISGGNVMITTNYASDIIKDNNLEKAKAFSYVEYAMIAGSLVGVFLGPIFAGTRFKEVGALYLILVIAIVGLFVIKNRVKNIKHDHITQFKFSDEFNLLKALEVVRGNKLAKSTITFRFIFHFIFSGYIFSIFIFLDKYLGVSPGTEVGIVMVAIIIITVLIQVFVCNKFVNKYGEVKSLDYSKVIMIVSLLLFFIIPFIDNKVLVGGLLLISFGILSIGVNICLNLFKFVLVSSVGEDKRSKILALEEQFLITAAALAPITTGKFISLCYEYNLPIQSVFLFFAVIAILYLVYDKVVIKRNNLSNIDI
jgi:DHA1 family tetracycline resistance protein-like MFS transporter